MSRLPTASAVGRVMSCPASHALPQEDRGSSEAAEAGTARHTALRAHLAEVAHAPDAATAAWLQGVVEADVLQPLRYAVGEVALAYDVLWGKARKVGVDVGREYGEVGPTEVVGSADYLAHFDGRLLVADLKTGRSEVPPPADNPQLLTLALAASLVKHSEVVEVGLLLAPEGSAPRWQLAEVSPQRLAVHADALADMHQRIEEARDDVLAGRRPRHLSQGTHCRYCPARGACPAQQSLAQSATTAPETFRATWQASLAAGEAAPVYRALLALRSEADAIEEAMREAARQGPLDVGDGRQYGWRVVQRESIDAEAAWTVLGQRYGVETARAAMTLATSKAGIERALRPVVEARKASGEKVTLKKAAEEALGALREAGAVQVQSNERCEEMAK